MGLRAGLDRCGKSHTPPGFDDRTVHPVGSRYTDYVTRPTFLYLRSVKECVGSVGNVRETPSDFSSIVTERKS